MTKEIERLKYKIRYNKAVINVYDYMNYIFKSIIYEKKIEQYQNELSELYKRVQDLKELNK